MNAASWPQPDAVPTVEIKLLALQETLQMRVARDLTEITLAEVPDNEKQSRELTLDGVSSQPDHIG